MAASYATREDVYRHGLPRGSLAQRPRVVAAVDATTNRIEVEGHGCVLNTPLQFAVKEGGALPAPLSASTVYYARPVADSDSLLEVAASVNGSAVDLTNTGTDPILLILPIGPLLDTLLDFYSRDFDLMCVGHAVPFGDPLPAAAPNYVGVLTAWHAAKALGLGTQADGLKELKDEVTTKALRFAKGVPLRDGSATSPANLATYGSAAPTTTETIP
jgi:hypothetical protein